MERNEGLWAVTARRVAVHWKARLQRHAEAYPVLFFLALALKGLLWCVKCLVWTLPVLLVRLVAAKARSRRDDQELATVSALDDARRAA